MEQQKKLNLTAQIFNVIKAAWENGYYTESELNSNSINFVEIREWCGLDPEVTPDDLWVDAVITETYNLFKFALTR